MKIDPVGVLRNSGIAAAFVAVSYAGPAVATTPSYCSTLASDRITTCFLDLTKTPALHHSRLRAGTFVGTSAKIGTGTGTPVSAGLQSMQRSSEGQSPDSRDIGIRIPYGSARLGNIAKVSICDRRGDNKRCARQYEFQLDANEQAGSERPDRIKVVTIPSTVAISSQGNDIRVVTSPPPVTNSSPPVTSAPPVSNSSPPDDVDEGPTGNVAELSNNDKPNGNGDYQALIPASSFSNLPDNTFVYVYTTYTGPGKCQDGPGDSTCPTPAAAGAGATAVPLPSTVLLLGIGLVGLIRMRRHRSPDLGASH